MVYKRFAPTPIRFSENDLRIIKEIQICGDFDSISSTIRFCTRFTHTILKNIPESIAKSYVEEDNNNNNKK